jgi:cytochrome c-type biogenesis protein CcmF
MHVGGYTLTYRALGDTRTAAALERRAEVDVSRGGDRVATVFPGKNAYVAEQQTSNEMAIYTNWWRAEDVDVIADQMDPKTGVVYFKALVKPLVNFLWIGGVVFLIGSLIALWPDAREQRRLVARYALAQS